MLFTLTISCSNTPFCNEETGLPDTTSRAQELARILEKVMRQVDSENQEGVCLDVNGNRVGAWAIRADNA